MTSFEEQLQEKLEHSLYEVVSGSRLYGTNKEGSDTDIRGFIIPPFESIIGIRPFEQYQHPAEDTKIYSLYKFIKLVMMGDPGCIEMLFVPEHQVLKRSCVSDIILENRELFLSQNIRRRLMGFSYSEFRKAMGLKMEIPKNKSDNDFILNVRNYCKEHNFDHDETEEIIDSLLSKHDKKLVSSKADMGLKRKLEFEKYGFGVSSASHSIRLLGELKELLTTKKIVFPRHDCQLLKDIRTGKIEKEKVEEIYNLRLKEVDELGDGEIVLPNKPDHDKCWKVYYDIILEEFDINFYKSYDY